MTVRQQCDVCGYQFKGRSEGDWLYYIYIIYIVQDFFLGSDLSDKSIWFYNRDLCFRMVKMIKTVFFRQII